jgi:hypothetical protein
MEGTAALVVELRAGLDVAAGQIGAEKLLLSVCSHYTSFCFGSVKVRETDLQYAAPCGSAWKYLDIPKMDQVSFPPCPIYERS